LNLVWLTSFVLLASATAIQAGQRRKVSVPSTADATDQPCYVILPDSLDPQGQPVPLLVSLHSWSGDVEQRNATLERLAEQKGWIYLFPHFRGPNQHPDACGSLKAQQDILDAVHWAQKNYPIDPQRIYLTGASGGGHMTLLMVGRHPEVWAAASAWVGISDLAAWHERHAKDHYGEMLRKSCGGAPGDSPEVDSQYRERSPITHLHRAKDVPLDIAAGVHDGHRGSVSIRHSLDAFNAIAGACGAATITPDEIEQLSRENGHLENPFASDQAEDPAFGRKIFLRRHAGKSRITIFEGGHEDIPTATIAWLDGHVKNE
jgi:prepilin-type processing-associated H-X9-DG protein